MNYFKFNIIMLLLATVSSSLAPSLSDIVSRRIQQLVPNWIEIESKRQQQQSAASDDNWSEADLNDPPAPPAKPTPPAKPAPAPAPAPAPGPAPAPAPKPAPIYTFERKFTHEPTLSPTESQRFHIILGDFEDAHSRQQASATADMEPDYPAATAPNKAAIALQSDAQTRLPNLSALEAKHIHDLLDDIEAQTAAEPEVREESFVPNLPVDEEKSYTNEYINGILRLKSSLVSRMRGLDFLAKYRNSLVMPTVTDARKESKAFPSEVNIPISSNHHMYRRLRNVSNAHTQPRKPHKLSSIKPIHRNYKKPFKKRNKMLKAKLKKENKSFLDSLKSSLSGTFHSLTSKLTGSDNIATTSSKAKKSKTHDEPKIHKKRKWGKSKRSKVKKHTKSRHHSENAAVPEYLDKDDQIKWDSDVQLGLKREPT